MLDTILSDGGENIAGLGTSRTLSGAIITLMAKPNIDIFEEVLFHSPGSPRHFLAGKSLFVRGERAGSGTGTALNTLFETYAATFPQGANKLQIRFD
jgi:hypothetical protein